MNNIFEAATANGVIDRINRLAANNAPQWGKMSAPQMLAHCNVTYEMAFEDKHKAPNAFTKLMLKLFVKKLVTTDKPYKKSNPTAPAFIIKGDRDFDAKKTRLINYIKKTQEMGGAAFDGRESLSFGKLNTAEWNNMFYKHLDHHLTQFGV